MSAGAASSAALPHTVTDCWDAAGAPNALGYDAQLSLLQWRLKKSSGLAKHRANAQSLLQQCRAGASLVALAEANDVAPASLARVVVEAHLGAQKSKVSKYLREPHRIDEPALREAVAAALDADPMNGPGVDTARRLLGIEYEVALQQALHARGVPFLTEGELRARGEAKTPDALLLVPLLVRGRAVNWIDSKAMYGEAETHGEYYASQYTAYLNRFDAGMVIYWYGYDAAADTDPRVLLADGFPAECELMSHMQLPRRQSSGAIVGVGGET